MLWQSDVPVLSLLYLFTFVLIFQYIYLFSLFNFFIYSFSFVFFKSFNVFSKYVGYVLSLTNAEGKLYRNTYI